MRYRQCRGCYTLSPIANIQCMQCEKSFDLPKDASATVHVFRTGLYEHIGPDSIYIGNKKTLIEECNRHGVRSWQMW